MKAFILTLNLCFAFILLFAAIMLLLIDVPSVTADSGDRKTYLGQLRNDEVLLNESLEYQVTLEAALAKSRLALIVISFGCTSIFLINAGLIFVSAVKKNAPG